MEKNLIKTSVENLRRWQAIREKIRSLENLIGFNETNMRYIAGECPPNMFKIEEGKQINEGLSNQIKELKKELPY